MLFFLGLLLQKIERKSLGLSCLHPCANVEKNIKCSLLTSLKTATVYICAE